MSLYLKKLRFVVIGVDSEICSWDETNQMGLPSYWWNMKRMRIVHPGVIYMNGFELWRSELGKLRNAVRQNFCHRNSDKALGVVFHISAYGGGERDFYRASNLTYLNSNMLSLIAVWNVRFSVRIELNFQ